MTEEEYCGLWGIPFNFKGVDFYPIKLYDYAYYNLLQELFCVCKSASNDIDILHASYLKFRLFVSDNLLNCFKDLILLLNYVTHYQIQSGDIDIQCEDTIKSVKDIKSISIKIKDTVFNDSDFEKIREIMLFQNGISMKVIETYDITLEEKLKYYNRKIDMPDLDEEIMAFSVIERMPLNEVKEYTFYQFKKCMDRIMLLKEYESFKPLEVSGQISFKDGSTIKDWLCHIPEKGRYDSILIDKDKFVKENDFIKSSADGGVKSKSTN